MRNFLIIANWKLNNNKTMIKKFFQELKNQEKIIANAKCHIAIAPSLIYAHWIKKYIINYPNISLAAQNVDIHISGAFSGETSATMLKEFNIEYVIIGHSERRKYHKENNIQIAEKFKIVKQIGLIPILCIGENTEERKSGKTNSVCVEQLNTILKLFGPQAFKNTIIAYEPIWAIGTGITDNPKNIQKTHKFIRNYIADHDQEIAKTIVIQYGGSVNQDNIQNLLIQPDIDGVLIGTASLNAYLFTSIIEKAEKIKLNI